jgi:hypothetical protein
MRLAMVIAEDGPKPVARISRGNARQFQHLGHHEKHNEATVDVDRDIAMRNLRKGEPFRDDGAWCWYRDGGLHQASIS